MCEVGGVLVIRAGSGGVSYRVCSDLCKGKGGVRRSGGRCVHMQVLGSYMVKYS